MWQGEEEELTTNIEVEFVVENRVVVKMQLKISLEDEEAIPVTKSPEDCINEYFAREKNILSHHHDFIEGNKELDFMRMKRFFLFTAYNDLCDLDFEMLENKELKAVKHEVALLYRDFEEYNKKTQYPLPYAFERIFLVRQVSYTHLEQYIEDVKIGMAGAKAELNHLAEDLKKKSGL